MINKKRFIIGGAACVIAVCLIAILHNTARKTTSTTVQESSSTLIAPPLDTLKTYTTSSSPPMPEQQTPVVVDPALNQAKKDFSDATEEELRTAIKQGLNLKMIKEERVSNVTMQLNTFVVAVRQYHQMLGEYPKGSNAEIVRELTGENPKKMIFVEWPPKQLSSSGELLDPWGTPFQMSIGADGAINIRSAGKDRMFWTADDEVFKH
jgi:hypothetical protein